MKEERMLKILCIGFWDVYAPVLVRELYFALNQQGAAPP